MLFLRTSTTTTTVDGTVCVIARCMDRTWRGGVQRGPLRRLSTKKNRKPRDNGTVRREKQSRQEPPLWCKRKGEDITRGNVGGGNSDVMYVYSVYCVVHEAETATWQLIDAALLARQGPSAWRLWRNDAWWPRGYGEVYAWRLRGNTPGDGGVRRGESSVGVCKASWRSRRRRRRRGSSELTAVRTECVVTELRARKYI